MKENQEVTVNVFFWFVLLPPYTNEKFRQPETAHIHCCRKTVGSSGDFSEGKGDNPSSANQPQKE